MIKIYLGNVGSGKTASAVREMMINKSERKTYSNIRTKIKTQVSIKHDMIIKKTIKGHIKKKSTGTLEPIYEYSLNKEYWQKINEPINVILDEAHSILNSRRSMSKANIIITDWLSLIRRVLGEGHSGMGELILITQLPNRIDTIARDMATQIRYHICHYMKICGKCNCYWQENSEMPESLFECPQCKSTKILKCRHVIEVWQFKNMACFETWKMFSQQSFYKHYFITDIEKYFKLYDTLQWDNMFSEFY